MSVKKNMLKHENELSSYASRSIDSIKFKQEIEDIRPSYFRDIDKIIFSNCYSRYMDKTQVFSFNENDHISKRMLHVQLVSKIARTIGRALNLNEDLIEAISLGHDVGHVPFGHLGESILNEISLEYLNQPFMHNVQSVRTLMNLENNGNGVNLSLQVFDGILCHNGEKLEKRYIYKNKTKEEFIEEYLNCYKDKKNCYKLIPMTLEGCVVRISDVIGYLGKDIEDAIALGILDKEELPKTITDFLGETNSSIIDVIVNDIIQNSLDKPYIQLSDRCFYFMQELLNFNYSNIYNKTITQKEKMKIKTMFYKMFNYYLDALKNNRKDNSIYSVFINKMNKQYLEETEYERIVIDYIAGMTDDFFANKISEINS